MVEMDNVQQEIRDKYKNTWCPECGPCVELDIDYCCINCGSRCTGPGAEQATLLSAELEVEKKETKKYKADLARVVLTLKALVDTAIEVQDEQKT